MPDMKKLSNAATVAQQQSCAAAADAATDVSASVEIAETTFHALYKTHDSQSTGPSHAITGHNQRRSLEMPAIRSSASSINETSVKSHGRVHGTTVSTRTASRPSRRKH